MNTSKRVAIYLRLSNEDKDKINKLDDSESIKNQRHLLLSEIEKHPDFTLIDEYCDEDLSGAGTYRPEFERLIKDCKNKKIDIVLCKSQSRFSRDMEIIEKYIHNKFIEWNVRFIGLADNADTANTGNKKSRQINSLVNEWYLEDVSNNIRSAFQAKMKQGEFISPFASFGYEISKQDNNKLVIDPVASEIVKKIYNLYIKGLGFTRIANYLNKNKIPSPSLYKYQKGIKLNIISNRPREKIKWSPNAIKKILTNELYLGHLIQGKRTTVSYKNHKIITKDKRKWIKKENMHEAIIDKVTFNKVQTLIQERTKPQKSTGTVHNFSGKVYCHECGHYLKKKNSNTHQYLVCSNTKDGYHDCPNKKSIRYDQLEKIILNILNKKIKTYYDKTILCNLNIKTPINPITNKITFLKNQREKLNNQIIKNKKYLKSLYEDKVNNLITTNQFKELINIYNKNETNYQKELKTLDNKITFYQNSSPTNLSNTFYKYTELKTLNKIIIDEFIKKIYIGALNNSTNTRNIKIIWNFN